MHPVNAPVERGHDPDTTLLGAGNKVRLGKVEAVELVDFDSSQEQVDVDHPDRAESQDGTSQLGDTGPRQFVERFQDVHRLRHDQVGQKQLVSVAEKLRGASSEVWRVSGEVTDQDVGVEESPHR